MKIYLNGTDAVCDLHKNGFTDDFKLFGNDLLWVQENIFIRGNEFDIVEFHKVINGSENMDDLIIFGIFSPIYNIKGILINHYKVYTDSTPPIITRKLMDIHDKRTEIRLPQMENYL